MRSEVHVTDEARPLVAVEFRDGYAVLTLDDPAHRNALSLELSDALAAAVGSALAEGAGAIVLAATPPVFSAGGNLDDLITPKAPLRALYAGMLAVANAPVPTIAAVGGAAIGAGVNLPLACDVVLASPSATFDPRFLDVGIHPGGGHLWRLAHRVGPQGAAALVLCGDRLTGAEAAAAGLAWRCVPDDELLDRACGGGGAGAGGARRAGGA
ncbi:enoyl-CoA hydratase/isomerase family protein, partial [Frankia sp. CN4]|nr:enoyl-CoA hydratase/isomerase family protein [Frankia nepalensis]